MNKDKLIIFNTISNIFLLLVLFLGGFVWADTNGVWHRAEDVQGGTFGSDEGAINYTFNNDVYFNNYLRSGIYYIDIDGITGLNDLRSEKITSNAAQINGNLNITGNLIINSTKNCEGKLYTDSNGKILCGTDNAGGGITTESDPTVPASVKDGISWSEISLIPGGFSDGVDNTGLTYIPLSELPSGTIAGICEIPSSTTVWYEPRYKSPATAQVGWTVGGWQKVVVCNCETNWESIVMGVYTNAGMDIRVYSCMKI